MRRNSSRIATDVVQCLGLSCQTANQLNLFSLFSQTRRKSAFQRLLVFIYLLVCFMTYIWSVILPLLQKPFCIGFGTDIVCTVVYKIQSLHSSPADGFGGTAVHVYKTNRICLIFSENVLPTYFFLAQNRTLVEDGISLT